MLPKELEKIFNEYSEYDYSLSVTRADYQQEFQLDFLLHVQDINDTGEILQTWTIETMGHRKSQVSFESADFLKITSDSPLLWEFTDIQGELYFILPEKSKTRQGSLLICTKRTRNSLMICSIISQLSSFLHSSFWHV